MPLIRSSDGGLPASKPSNDIVSIEQSRLYGLDALRGIAALCILGFHAALKTVGTGQSNAGLAVDFFFMLSGYVMARTYERRFAEGLGGTNFLALRYTRLWPTMLVGTVLGLPLLLLSANSQTLAILAVAANLLMLPFFLKDEAFPANNSAWSIFFELLANLLHGTLFCRVRSSSLLLCIVIMGSLLAIYGTENLSFGGGHNLRGFFAGVPRVLFSYCLGVYLFRRWSDRPPFRPPSWFVIGAMPAVFLASLLLPHRSNVADFLIVGLLWPILMAGGLQLNAGKILSRLGSISFPLYALHAPLMSLAVLSGISALWAIPVAVVMASAMPGGLRLRWPRQLSSQSA